MSKLNSAEARAIGQMLKDRFTDKHVDSFLEHYETMIGDFRKSEWEKSILRAGKLVEAVLKILWVFVGNTVPKAKEFKVDHIIRELEKSPATVAADSLRLTIPRACRFIYDIASNRGARHDPDEIDPNIMDAAAVVSLSGWIVAEMLRYSQKGVNPSQARDQVLRLSQKKFPNLEVIEDRVYFEIEGLSARSAALLCLWHAHPRRVNHSELVKHAQRHGFTLDNAKKGVSRLKTVVDDDGQGNWLLRLRGFEEAEGLMCITGQ